MSRLCFSCLLLIATLGCANEPDVTVRIQTPEDGSVVAGDSVSVTLSADGIDIVPADGLPTPGRAHHHILLDASLPQPGQPIPADLPGVVHLGKGDSTLTLTDLAPGDHTLIAVLALGNHVPLDPWVVDTVNFSVTVAEQ